MPDFQHTTAAYEALTASLWRERELLEHLLFGLASQGALLRSGTLRWLSASSTQIAEVVDALREHEVTRSMVSEELAGNLGLTASSTLSDLASEASEPYSSILRELRGTLFGLTDELTDAVRCNEQLLLALVGPETPPGPVGTGR